MQIIIATMPGILRWFNKKQAVYAEYLINVYKCESMGQAMLLGYYVIVRMTVKKNYRIEDLNKC